MSADSLTGVQNPNSEVTASPDIFGKDSRTKNFIRNPSKGKGEREQNDKHRITICNRTPRENIRQTECPKEEKGKQEYTNSTNRDPLFLEIYHILSPFARPHG